MPPTGPSSVRNNRPYVTFANVAQFYQFPEYTRVSRTVSLRSERRAIRAQAGTSELSINGVRFFTDFPLLSSGDEDLISVMDVSKIIEPILRPSRIQKPERVETVILDPGHGGSDNGASSTWGSEKSFTLDVALAARKEFIRAGYRVEMTRATDIGCFSGGAGEHCKSLSARRLCEHSFQLLGGRRGRGKLTRSRRKA